jgi:hypothetical protein
MERVNKRQPLGRLVKRAKRKPSAAVRLLAEIKAELKGIRRELELRNQYGGR